MTTGKLARARKPCCTATQNTAPPPGARPGAVSALNPDQREHIHGKLGVGAKVDIGVENGRLVIEPKVRPTYTLDELLAQCDEYGTPPGEDRAWTDAGPVGKELL